MLVPWRFLWLVVLFARPVACTLTPPPEVAQSPVAQRAAPAKPTATALPKPRATATPTRTPASTPPSSVTAAPAKPSAVGSAGATVVNGIVVAGPRAARKVALTFDMGSAPAATLQLLAKLEATGVRGTYFVTGQWVEKNPLLLKAIVAGLHEVGNHSYSHPNFTKIDRTLIIEELSKTEDIVQRTAGVSTYPYWRPPFGAFDEAVLRVVRELGYTPIYWTLDSGDWRADSTPASIAARVVADAGPGAIVVMHGALAKTARALDDIIPQLRAKGLQPTSLGDVLERL